MARERVDRNGDLSQNVLSIAELRRLITLMNGGDIGEITIEDEASGLKLTLRKPAPEQRLLASAPDSYDEEDDGLAAEGAATGAAVTRVTVTAPYVGHFRATAKPGAKPLLPGDVVKTGAFLGAIQALNVLNEVEAPADGRLVEILIVDDQPVEYGQPLMTIETKIG